MTATMPTPARKRRWPSRVFSNRIVQIGLAAWVGFSAAIPFLAHGTVPFNQPMLAGVPYRARVLFEIFGPVVALIFIAVAYGLTRRRVVDVAAHSPEPAAGWRLTAHQLALGGALTFALSLFGTGLPIMIFLTSILVPRYQKLTGSTAATCVLSGFTYAAMHLTEYWTRYDSPAHAALSVIFIVLLFGGPGMVKAYLTLRTGNAWVHLWGYHMIWPHLTGDTPVFVKIFAIR